MKKKLAILICLTLVIVFTLGMTSYAYAEGSTTTVIEPTGLDTLDCVLLIFIAIVCLVVIALIVIKFFKMPTAEQKKTIKEWLKWAVFHAEQYLGNNTGALKLRLVYDWFITRMPWAACLIKFETFKEWVDEALEYIESEVEKNGDIAALWNEAHEPTTANLVYKP